MFSKKKKSQSKTTARSRGNKPADDFGLGLFGLGGSGGRQPSQDDEDLEAELRALTGAVGKPTRQPSTEGNSDSDLEAELLDLVGGKSKPSRKKQVAARPEKPKLSEIKHVLSGDAESANEDHFDEEVDENDPELLQELLALNESDNNSAEEGEEEEEAAAAQEEKSFVSVLQERLELYKTAEQKAKEAKESSRARRFNRGIKTLEGLIKKAQAGQPVLDSEIPPMIANTLKPPSENVEQPPQIETDNSNMENATHTVTNITPSQPQVCADKVPQNIITDESKVADTRGPEVPQNETSTNNNETQLQEERHALEPKLPKIDNVSLVEPEDNTTPQPINTPLPEQRTNPKPLIKTPSSSNVPGKHLVANRFEDKQKPTEHPVLEILRARREEYKIGAINAKKKNDMSAALNYVKTVKVLDSLISNAEQGQNVDVSSIPPPISKARASLRKAPSIEVKYAAPKTVMEALQQRLKIYRQCLAAAEKERNERAIQQNSKIVKLYTEVIKMHIQGKAIPLERLPTPPGCPPIPLSFQV